MSDCKDLTMETRFENVQYLGCSQLVNNDSDNEMKSLMKVLDEQTGAHSVVVTLIVPHIIAGTAKLIDNRGNILSSFPLVNIRFCIRGDNIASQNTCFGISLTHRSNSGECNNPSDTIHQCHVFRTSKSETAAKALYSFSHAFSNKDCDPELNRLQFQFESTLEIQENDGTMANPNWKLCPQHNGVFRVRRDREKKIIVHLKQITGFLLNIKKCFGMLLAAGRNLRHSDLQLLEMARNETSFDSAVFLIEANWDPRVHMFEVLNTETPRDTRVFMTVAVDVIVNEINEPIRFSMEAMSRVFHEHERFYKTPQTIVSEEFILVLEKNSETYDCVDNKLTFISLESDSDRKRSQQNVGKSPSRMPTQLLHPTGEDESDCDEPLLSGSGKVSQECGEEALKTWIELIENWNPSCDKPDKISELVLDGIPDKFRGHVWQLLANVATEEEELIQKYRRYLEKPCPSEQVIMRDIHRTFPAHEHFKVSGGDGQQSLYRLSKVYSLYDEEVSYCQGLSFLAASLLLHMSEEYAFCTLVKIMFNYGLRDLFKLGFDNLHLRFFQLTFLMKDYLPDLWKHLNHIGIETHMYASQWFLTLFTAKFPLQMVFFILDLFLSKGMNTIFHISLALLQDAKTDLLQLDFEGTLKYFRVSLPRRYRTETATKCLIQKAVKFKINHKKLEKYEKEYLRIKELERENEDPVLRMEKEISRHLANTLRLERENDDLAHELVTSKIELRKKLDVAEDQLETYANLIERNDVVRLEDSSSRAEKLLAEYKKLFSERSKRAESEREHFEAQKKSITARISDCEKCWLSIVEWEKNQSPINASAVPANLDIMAKLEERENHIKSLEIDLAQTKLSLVEAECRNQDLTHQLMSQSESDGKKWLKKTLTQLKEVGSSLKHHERSTSSMTP
ncbi:unnamed protein product [Caenorhabditis sp. 36 PRJEB53466]|nr:unnamed protein product [Caenorhabditis sp. 36 PRJEB53466]